VRYPQLLYGSGDPRTIPVSKTPLDLSDSSAIHIKNAEIFYTLYELKMNVAEAILPVSLHPSIPALFSVTFVSGKHETIGTFNLAYIGIACRTGIKPRHLIIKSFCDNDVALKLFAARYGFNASLAEISCRETYDRVNGTIRYEDRTVANISIGNCIPLVGSGGVVKYSPALNACVLDGQTKLVQFEANYEFKTVIRGEPSDQLFDSKALGHEDLSTHYPVAGTHAVADINLLPARFQVDLVNPAETGGATKITKA
jgi:hypothetical protein